MDHDTLAGVTDIATPVKTSVRAFTLAHRVTFRAGALNRLIALAAAGRTIDAAALQTCLETARARDAAHNNGADIQVRDVNKALRPRG